MGDPFKNFYRGRRVFVTGHTGFKGSWLTQWLLDLGAVVKGYSLEPPTEPALFKILGLENEMEHCIGDIRDQAKLQQEILSFHPEVVFHLAAQPLVRRSYKDPRQTFETNVMGTINLYEAIRSCESVRAIVCITTDKCYENREWVWGYRESDPMGGYDPYSASKGCVEILSAAYRRSFFQVPSVKGSHVAGLATARAGNVIGGGDWAEDRLVPDCVAALTRKEPIVIRNPKAVRPWQHVLEPLSGYLILAMKMHGDPSSYSESWNFGPTNSDSRSVEWVVERLCTLWPGGGRFHIEGDLTMHETSVLRLDCSKANMNLNWYAKWDIDCALRKTVEWHLEGTQDRSYVNITRSQIAEYMRALSD